MHSIVPSVDSDINGSVKELKKISRPHKRSFDNVRKRVLIPDKRITQTWPQFSEGSIEACAGLNSPSDYILEYLRVFPVKVNSGILAFIGHLPPKVFINI